jgi:hypothetical protein
MGSLRLKRKRRTPEAAPSITSTPTVVSEQVGVYQVGVLLTSDPPTFTPSTSTLSVQWLADDVAISGATSASFLPTETQEGATIKARWTASTFGASVSATTAGVGPVLEADPGEDPGEIPPDLTNALAGLNALSLASRAAKVAEFADCWPGYADQAFQGDYLVGTAAAFNALFNAGGSLYTPDTTKWYRIRLDSTADASAWAADLVVKGRVYSTTTGLPTTPDKDYVAGGGGILIESSNPADPVALLGKAGSTAAALSVNGARGIHIRSLRAAKIASASTDAARDAASGIRVQRTTTYAQLPVVRIQDCGIGGDFNPSAPADGLRSGVGIIQTGACEQLDVIDNVFSGCQTSISITGCRYFRRWGNDFQRNIGDATIVTHIARVAYSGLTFQYGATDNGWDERTCTWSRMNTLRNLLDSSSIANQHTDPLQIGTSGDIGPMTALVEFECYYGARARFADVRRFTFSGNPTNGQTMTVSGTVFTFRTTASLSTDIQIGATLSATLTSAASVITAASITNVIQALVQGSTQLDIHYAEHSIGSTSATASGSWASLRIGGGTQGIYADDTGLAYSHDILPVCSIIAGTASELAFWNGTGTADRVHLVRPGEMIPNAEVGADGFTYSTDVEAYATSGRKSGSPAPTISHTIRNSVLGKVTDLANSATRTADGTYTGTSAALLLDNNRYVKWQTGAENADTLLAGTFTRDAQGRLAYTMQNDGLNTQAQFRAAMYAQLRLANVTDRAAIGTTDPATWI